jgi:hypothetical protein
MCFKFKGTVELPSPSDILTPGMAYLTDPGAFYNDGIRLRLKKEYVIIPFNQDPVVWACSIPDTNSMDPVFDKGHDNLYLQGENPADQGILVNWLAQEWLSPPVGEKPRANIIVYRTTSIYAVHRLAEIKQDIQGRKWYFRGDNNSTRDAGFARDSEIQWVLTMTAY